jgi:transposase-like protein
MVSVLSATHFHNEAAAYDFVEARLWPNGPVCPFCGATKEHIGRLSGKSTRAGLRKCYACRKPFTVKMGTVLESSHAPLRIWLQAIHLICSSKKGISTRQLQRTLGVGMKTAWFLGHRIREMMKTDFGLFTPPLGGSGMTIEVDETFIGRKPGMKIKQGGGHKHAVLALVERDGGVRSFHVPNVKAETLRAIIATHASRTSHLMSDEATAYVAIGWNFASHGSVKHSADEYVRGNIHTNTIEGFFSILKRGVYGVYQHVSESHLKRYLAEFDFRYSNREKLGVNDVGRAEIALKGAKGKRLTYATSRRNGQTEAHTA